jgi:hypothetical protein
MVDDPLSDDPPRDSALATRGQIHLLRTSNPMNPEIMAGYPSRLSTNRSNPYTEPGGYNRLAQGRPLPVFGSWLCTSTAVPSAPAPVDPYWPTTLVNRVNQFVYGDPLNRGKAPPCEAQAPLGRVIGQSGAYPQLQPLP